MVAAMTQMKKDWYPIVSCRAPLNMPGIIMPRAINPVQIA